jgi:hypothetical protein
MGLSDTFGVIGVSDSGKAIEGRTGSGTAIVGLANDPNGHAGVFFGRVQVNGDIEVSGDVRLRGGDVAEQFDLAAQGDAADEVTAGTVVVLDRHGALTPCAQEYDPCVAGVVSGAGDRVPALILDRTKERDSRWRRAIAVVGKAWCKADATVKPIRVGNLLTTSATPGHAMAAVDREASFGAVLGKALTPLDNGRGLVLVLVGLG